VGFGKNAVKTGIKQDHYLIIIQYLFKDSSWIYLFWVVDGCLIGSLHTNQTRIKYPSDTSA